MCDLGHGICHTPVKQLCSSFFEKLFYRTQHMPFRNNSVKQNGLKGQKLKEEVTKTAHVQMLLAIGIMCARL